MDRSDRHAWAFRYDPGEDGAPVLVASGKGTLAEKILLIAEEAGVPVVSDPEIAPLLSSLRVGDWIPEELYSVFVGILASLYRLDHGNVGRRRFQ